jgi:hypothetical protein
MGQATMSYVDPASKPRSAAWLWWAVPLGLVGSIVLGFVGIFIVRPIFVMRDFNRFVERHPIGSSIEDVATDPFTDQVTLLIMDGQFIDAGRQTGREQAQNALRGKTKGELHLMWTHTPPFGRVNITFTFDGGRILDAKTGSLD